MNDERRIHQANRADSNRICELHRTPHPERDRRRPNLPPEDLFQRFHALGVAIGSSNLAYWFYWAAVLEEPMSGLHVEAVIITPTASFNEIIARHSAKYYHRFEPAYDTDRARRYCDKYSLRYDDGPYLVYSEAHPDAVAKPDITLSLRGLSYDQYLSVLNALEQSLLVKSRARWSY